MAGASQVARWVKNLPVSARDAGDRAQSLGQEDALQEGMTTYSSTLPGASHGQRSLGDHSPWVTESDVTELLSPRHWAEHVIPTGSSVPSQISEVPAVILIF